MQRSLSGIKPTATPHMGNHLGMVQPAIALQRDHDPFYFIADENVLSSNLRQHRHRISDSNPFEVNGDVKEILWFIAHFDIVLLQLCVDSSPFICLEFLRSRLVNSRADCKGALDLRFFLVNKFLRRQ